MSNLPLGQIITTEQQKDAIHVAVAPVEAGEWLAPGHHVRIAASGKAVAAPQAEAIGIVDPFLKQHVTIGQRFWLFLYPGTITSLRHDWTHPAFETVKVLETAKPVVANEHEAWIAAFAAKYSHTFERAMQAADEWVQSQKNGSYGEYWCDGGTFEGEVVPDEFWTHYEALRGPVAAEHKGSFFTCSC